MSVVCLSIASGCMCQFGVRCEHVNILRTTVSPAKCEMFGDVQFLQAEWYNAAEIHRRMSNMYGPTFMSDSEVCQFCRNFETGCSDVHHAGIQEKKRGSSNR